MNKYRNNNEKLILGVLIGSLIGFLIYWTLDIVPIYAETIFLIFVILSILLGLLILIISWYRNKIIKKLFGKNIEFETIANDTQETLELISENLLKNTKLNKAQQKKIHNYGPKIINYILWSNFRNWGLKIILSFIVGLGGIATTILILNQNKLFEIQNKRIEQQTHLIEADRRSAQVFIMGEVLSDINNELNSKENIKRSLSSPLIGRIISLSNAMKPYRYLENDSLTQNPSSPERGQLLVSLVESDIDSIQTQFEILHKSNFSYSDLRNADLCENNLNGIKLNNAYFSESNVCNVKLQNAKLENIYAFKSDFSHTYFNGANIKNSSFINCYFWGSDLRGIDFTGVDLSKSDLMKAKFDEWSDFSNIKSLDSVYVHRFDWLTYMKDSIKVRGFEKIFNEYIIDSSTWEFARRDEKYPILIKKKNK